MRKIGVLWVALTLLTSGYACAADIVNPQITDGAQDADNPIPASEKGK